MAAKRGGPAAPRVGYSQRSRVDKLGVKPDMRVALIGLSDPVFLHELRERTADVHDRASKGTAMILFQIDGTAPLARLTTLRKAIAPDGMIWVLWPKGQKHITEDVIRRAAIAQDLVDVKVMAFSEILSGLKLVIPLAKR